MNDTIQTARTVNRKHKDTLFRYIFADKKALLSLYNALNGTDYADENELEVNTLDDAIYLGRKNDLSFIIGSTLNLYEHQSTINPNMPLRGLHYISSLYSAYTDEIKADIYGSSLVRLPCPQYVVFYNGTEGIAERMTLRLSDAFHEVTGRKAEPCLELVATVVNINYGNNKELLAKCRELEEYAFFIHLLRGHVAGGHSFAVATQMAVDECIERNILHDILSKNRAEVYNMMLYEYDESRHYESLRREGMNNLNSLYAYLLDNNMLDELRRSVSDQSYQQELLQQYKASHPGVVKETYLFG